MKRFAQYEGWKIEASPIILVRQRLFQVGVVIERDDGERFVFSDLGNRVYRWQAYERGIEWAKHWIDTNYRLGAHKPPREVRARPSKIAAGVFGKREDDVTRNGEWC